jgi:UDP:flavonoid glycosyltransferase YjiC (YdhE family)
MLADKGHDVAYSFPEQFAGLLDSGKRFYRLSPRIIELIESEEGRTVMGKAGLFAKIKAIQYLYKEGKAVNKELVEQQYKVVNKESPDLIIHNVKCNYPILWGMKYNKRTVLLSPVPYFMYYVEGHSHIGFNINLGRFFNKLTYRISNFGLVKTIYDAQKHLPENLELTKRAIKKTLFERELIYTISPQLFQRPTHWPNHVQVLGYPERDKSGEWHPDGELIGFLSRHEKVLFLTFGSMVNNSPEEITQVIYRVLNTLKVPTIINTAAGGLLRLKEFQDINNLYFVEQIPYDWILPRVYATIHHGGSGTTHLALKYGCPTLIIPHIIDQYGWNNIIHEIGAGPKGVSINKLGYSNFRDLVEELLTNRIYKTITNQIASRMAQEQLELPLYRFITEDL